MRNSRNNPPAPPFYSINICLELLFSKSPFNPPSCREVIAIPSGISPNDLCESLSAAFHIPNTYQCIGLQTASTFIPLSIFCTNPQLIGDNAAATCIYQPQIGRPAFDAAQHVNVRHASNVTPELENKRDNRKYRTHTISPKNVTFTAPVTANPPLTDWELALKDMQSQNVFSRADAETLAIIMSSNSSEICREFIDTRNIVGLKRALADISKRLESNEVQLPKMIAEWTAQGVITCEDQDLLMLLLSQKHHLILSALEVFSVDNDDSELLDTLKRIAKLHNRSQVMCSTLFQELATELGEDVALIKVKNFTQGQVSLNTVVHVLGEMMEKKTISAKEVIGIMDMKKEGNVAILAALEVFAADGDEQELIETLLLVLKHAKLGQNKEAKKNKKKKRKKKKSTGVVKTVDIIHETNDTTHGIIADIASLATP